MPTIQEQIQNFQKGIEQRNQAELLSPVLLNRCQEIGGLVETNSYFFEQFTQELVKAGITEDTLGTMTFSQFLKINEKLKGEWNATS